MIFEDKRQIFRRKLTKNRRKPWSQHWPLLHLVVEPDVDVGQLVGPWLDSACADGAIEIVAKASLNFKYKCMGEWNNEWFWNKLWYFLKKNVES
jgi:hypothetical protein